MTLQPPPTPTRSALAVARALAVIATPRVNPQVAFEAPLPGVNFAQLCWLLVNFGVYKP